MTNVPAHATKNESHGAPDLQFLRGAGAIVPFEELNLVPSSVYHCPVCKMEFFNKARFRHHYMTHSGEKPYGCPHCPYRARQGGTLKHHILMKHMPRISSTYQHH